MQRDELVRLAGEQVLLKKEAAEVTAAFNRDKAALLSLYNSINSGHLARGWLDDGITLLTRLHQQQGQLAEMRQQIDGLAQLTGL